MTHHRVSIAPARRLAGVLQPVIPEIGELVHRTPGTLSLAQGMVSWGPPLGVMEALQTALAPQPSGSAGAPSFTDPSRDTYGPVRGDPVLLAALASSLEQHHGIDLDGADLWVTAGSNMAFNAIAQVLCAGPPAEPSEVILPLPYYFNHVMAVQLAGGRPVAVDAGLVPDPQRLAAAITPRTRAIVTVSPNNPSGVVMPRSVLEAINGLCASHGLVHISDEAYGQFVYGAEPHWSPGSLPGAAAHTVTLQSLSKAYGMAGWRVGFMAAPSGLGAALAKVQDTVLICPPRLMQRAAVAALAAGPAWCRPRIAELAGRRRQLLKAVADAQSEGLHVRLLAEPSGAFYGLLALEPTPAAGGLTSDVLMRRLVLEHRVAAVSGESFGLAAADPAAGGQGPTLRLSYGLLNADDLQEALRRLFGGIRALLAAPHPNGP
ncbi:MAG: aminotransferase class I/II-fold pyridoxal phosphate-dependent enzyme [Cyanobacteriota bacterium]|nr:aminotransferase class I/II-fold pyridoxal phosphate-dependent enzyme [Cyanobacteriota bacterium]